VTVVPFGNRCIFDKPVEKWPIVDFLICFYSAGFPLAKAEEYVRLRDPICFNDVLSQHVLLDRTAIYALLRSNGIPVPTYEVFVAHGSPSTAAEREPAMRKQLLELTNEDPGPEEIQALNAPPDASDFSEDMARKAAYWGDVCLAFPLLLFSPLSVFFAFLY